MNLVNLVTDGYERKARLYPALLLIAPIVITIVGMFAGKLSALESFATVVAGSGGAFLLAQLARDAGKERERAFFESWGGLPSVAVLRHSDTRIEPITKARYHKTLSTLVKGTKAPSPEEEAADPFKADQVYASWSSYLRVHTRDVKKFPLVFHENVNYGYRRNLCGLRRVGIILSALSSAVSAFWFYHQRSVTGEVRGETVVAFACTVVILSLWIFRFSPDWVHLAADAYAERLAESVDSIADKRGTAESKPRKRDV